MTLRLAFMGTPDFAVPTLAELIAQGHDIACVYSQPPRPKGRGMALEPGPVHKFAESAKLPVHTPPSLKGAAEQEEFAALNLDAAIVVAYGLLLPKPILDAPKLGCFNLHGSLLPRWRGAAPIQRAIMAGDAVTGVEVMRMTEGLDEGPVLASETLRIGPLDTAGTLHDRMAAVGFTVIGTAIALIFPIERYTDFLYVLGSVFSPLVAILLTDYFVMKCDNRSRRGDAAATVSLVSGIAFYYFIKAQELPVGSTLTTIVFTAALHYVLRRWRR